MGDNIRLKGPLGLKQDIYDDKRAKEFKKLFQLTPKEFIAEYDKKLLEEKKQEKDGGYMKVKKLLPGGLLTTGMRIMMKTARSAGLKKTPKIADEEFQNLKKVRDVIQKGEVSIEGKKFDTSFLSEKDKVFKDMSIVLAKQKKARGFEKIAEAFKKSKEISPVARKEIELTVPKLKEYDQQADEKLKAIMLKDVFKPKMNKSGGFIDMTKDKKYYKGRI